MSRRRNVPDHCASFVNTSPIARLIYWAMKRHPLSSDDSKAEGLSLCLAKEDANERNLTHKDQCGTIIGEELHTYDSTCAGCAAADCADSKVHNWALGRRIFIAAVISWYT